MAQIPVINGIYTDGNADFRSSYPVNMVPVPKGQGISNGYLRPADGIVQFGEGPGIDRGGISWRDLPYRVMGTKLVLINANGTATTLGDVGSGGQVSFDYSFDRLAVASGGRLYYWNGTSLTQVTDPDLGTVLDVIWIDGFFMTTDGENIVVTELNDPAAVDPLKYGSSEVDPDPVKAILKIQDEAYVLNRHTIEVFDNVGGAGFPFQRIDGAQITKGVLGTHTACVLSDAVAFLGSGRNEAPSIYLGSNATANKIATREIDQVLLEYGEDQLEQVLLETRVDKGHQLLYVHLPDRALVYDLAASIAVKEPVWFILTTATDEFAQFRAKNLIWAYDKWLVGDPQQARHGFLTNTLSSHWDQVVRWEFMTQIVYNASAGAIFHQLELVCLSGRTEFGVNATLNTSYSTDGETWSQDKFIQAGRTGQRNKRLVWFQQGHMRNWRIQRFRGHSDAFLSVARLEAQLEPLVF